jgi:hypothetical protein
MARLPKEADDRNDWFPPSQVGKSLPRGMPVEALYSPSRRKWLIPSTGEVLEDIYG